MKLKDFVQIFNLLSEWLWEVAAFILLPLIIYIIIFLTLGVQFSQLSNLPEWMFIAIILFGETLRKTIMFYKQLEYDFERNSMVMISWAILGISISSVLLAFSIIAIYKELELPIFYYRFQNFMFLIAILSSATFGVYIKIKTEQ